MRTITASRIDTETYETNKIKKTFDGLSNKQLENIHTKITAEMIIMVRNKQTYTNKYHKYRRTLHAISLELHERQA